MKIFIRVIFSIFILVGMFSLTLLTNSAGGAEDNLKKVILNVEGMTCPMCPLMVKTAVKNLEGVIEVDVNYKEAKAVVSYQEGKVTVEQIIKAIEKVGFKARSSESGPSVSADRSKTHEMMMDQKGSSLDSRRQIKIPDAMKVMQKSMMRFYMDALGEITSALATNDMKKAAAAARELGWKPEMEQMCEMVVKMSGEEDFRKLGMAMHKKADEVANFASAGKRNKTLITLSHLIKSCNACHATYRH